MKRFCLVVVLFFVSFLPNSVYAGPSENNIVCDQRCVYRSEVPGFATVCRGIDPNTGVTLWRNVERCEPDGPFQCSECTEHGYPEYGIPIRYSYYYNKDGHFAALASGDLYSMDDCKELRAKDSTCN